MVEPFFLQTFGHLGEIDGGHVGSLLQLKCVADDAVQAASSGHLRADLPHLLLIFEIRKLNFRKLINFPKQIGQVGDVLGPVLWHPSFQVRTNRSATRQNLSHPFGIQFRADTSQRRRYPALRAEVLVRRLKVKIAFG